MPLFTPGLKQSGRLDGIHVTLSNVGSRKLSEEGDYSKIWQVFAPNLTILGVDADPDACDAANANLEERQINWREKHLPAALGESIGEQTLYVTKHPMCSSLYAPNESYLQRFHALPELAGLDFTIDIETTTLDRFFQRENIESIDFLQIDVQGADLDVLQGGIETLSRGVLGVQIEVEFSPLYLGQPLFADVDTFLRQQGFTLFDLIPSYRTRRISPVASYRKGQLLWGEAFYFRDLIDDNFPLRFSLLQDPEKIFKLACIADVMDFTDYALELFYYLTVNHGKDSRYNFARNLIDALKNVPDLVTFGLDKLEVISQIKFFLSDSERKDLSLDS